MANPDLGLDDVIFPLSREAFFQSHWLGQPLFETARKDKLAPLLVHPQLQSLEALLKARTEKVRVVLPDFNDECSSIFVEPGEALKSYREQMTLVMDGMQKQCPWLAEMVKKIQADLGLPTGGENNLANGRAMAYATPAGGTTGLHFDANVNFVVQLKGVKRWRLAPNTSVLHPTDRYTSGTGEIPIALERQCEAMLLDEMPETHLEYFMEPGCVLFVPRGYWHETRAESDSLSLNFTYAQPSWADIFTLTLREHLHKTPGWRALADGLESADGTRAHKAAAHLQCLIAELGKNWSEVTAKQLLAEAGF